MIIQQKNSTQATSKINITPVGKVSHIIGNKRIHSLCALINNTKKYTIISKTDLIKWDNAKSKTTRQELFMKYFNFNNMKNIKSSPDNFETQNKLSL